MAGMHGSFGSLPDGMTSFLAPREEFQEEDVWEAGLGPKGKGSASIKHLRKSKSVPANHVPNSPSSSSGGIHIPQPTKPVNVPDWNKILKEEAPKMKWWDEDDDACYRGEDDDGDGDFSGRKPHRHEDEDEDNDMLPPHEFLARRWKRTGPVAYSMCEGVGRTLKGRDLVNLRNFVLSKTGFIE